MELESTDRRHCELMRSRLSYNDPEYWVWNARMIRHEQFANASLRYSRLLAECLNGEARRNLDTGLIERIAP